MATKPDQSTAPTAATLPSVERIQQELATATSIDDFFRKEGIFTRKRVPGLFAGTLEQMLEAELTAHLGYEPYAASGRNSGNSRNGKRPRSLRTSNGDMTIQVPRDRNSEFQPALLDKYQTSTNELEEKIIALYAKGVSTRDIQETLQELYGVRSRRRPLARSPTRSGRWSKPGRAGRLPPCTRSSIWMPFISSCGVMGGCSIQRCTSSWVGMWMVSAMCWGIGSATAPRGRTSGSQW